MEQIRLYGSTQGSVLVEPGPCMVQRRFNAEMLGEIIAQSDAGAQAGVKIRV